MSDQTNLLQAQRREPAGSRDARRLRRTGQVPGIVYGGEDAPVPFAINARDLRNTLAKAGAVLDFQLDGGASTPVVLKDLVRHPVSGETTHIDLLRVNLSKSIQTQVTIELAGAEDGPGVKQGGILEQPLREVTVEALPNEIPDAIVHDVSTLEVGATVTVADLVPPAGVTIVTDGEQIVASVVASRMSRASDGDEIETETELVGAAESGAGAASSDGTAADSE